MRCDLLKRCDKLRIFLYKVFHAADIDPFPLHGEEESILISRDRIDHFPLIQIIFQHVTDLVAEIDDGFFSAFPVDSGAAGVEIHIVDV